MVITDAKAATLMPILKQRIVPDSIVYSDSLPSDNALALAGFRHLRLNHSKLFATHLNASRTFGTKPSATCVNLTVFPRSIPPFSSRNVSGVLTSPIPKPNCTN